MPTLTPRNAALRQPNSYRDRVKLRVVSRLIPLLIAGGVLFPASRGLAQATAAPPEVANLLTQIDAAASEGNLEAVMQFYSPSFTSTDGLNYRTLETALSNFWQRYNGLTYQTELLSWQQDGDAIVTETKTTITGTPQVEGRDLTFTATLTARQRIQEQRIVEQEILDEESQYSTGANPPTLDVILPEQVSIGQPFEFDAVVVEPLGDRLLLGGAAEEPIRASTYLNPTPPELELLPAGGLFKVGRAPAVAGSRWVSAIIIRDDGITATTQRLQIVAGDAPSP